MEHLLNIARLVRVCGKIEGRKRLQKMVHILQECGYPFRERFSFHHFGPYSSDLKMEIDSLVAHGVLSETETGTSAGGYTTYTYQVSDEAEQTLGAQHLPPVGWEDLANSLRAQDATILEAISTILFLQRTGLADEALKVRFNALKPNLVLDYSTALRHAESLKKNKRLA